MVAAVDTSFLFSLYAGDVHTPAAREWLRGHGRPLRVTILNQFELRNAFRFAEFQGALESGESVRLLADLDADWAGGRLEVHECNLADLVAEAERLSAIWTVDEGHRSFDVLHVAGALVLGADGFLTFDANQKRLAESENLVVPL